MSLAIVRARIDRIRAESQRLLEDGLKHQAKQFPTSTLEGRLDPAAVKASLKDFVSVECDGVLTLKPRMSAARSKV